MASLSVSLYNLPSVRNSQIPNLRVGRRFQTQQNLRGFEPWNLGF